jgi:hypothetical protein
MPQETITEVKQVETVKSVQEEVIALAERRVLALMKIDSLKDDLSGVKDDIKDMQGDINAIDKLFKEKFEKLNELRTKR